MAQLAGSLEIQIFAGIARLQKDMGDAKRVVGDTVGTINKVLGTIGVGLSVAGTVALVKAMIDATDAVKDLSERLSVGIKDLAAWKLMADQNGTSMEGVGTAIKKLSVYMAENADKLRTLGVTAKEPQAAMLQLADVFQQLPDGATRTALAVKLFGKSGTEMIPILIQGSAAIRDSQKATRAYGEALAASAPLADQFNDQMALFKINAATSGQVLLAGVLPSMSEILEFSISIQKEWGSIAAILFGVVGGTVLKAIGINLDPIKRAVDETATALKGLQYEQRKLGNISKAVEQWGIGQGRVAAQQKVVNEAQAQYNAALKAQMVLEADSQAKADAKYVGSQKLLKAQKDMEEAAKRLINTEGQKKSEAEKYIASLEKETAQLGLNAIQQKMVEAAEKAGTATTAKQAMAVMTAAAAWAAKKRALESVKEANDKARAAEDEYSARLNATDAATMDATKSLEQKVIAINDETFALSATVIQLRELAIQRALEQSGLANSSKEWAEYAARLREAMTANEAAKATKAAVDEIAGMAKSAEAAMHNAFIDWTAGAENAADRMWRALKTGFFDLLWTAAAKPILVSLVTQTLGSQVATSAFGASAVKDAAGGSSLYQMYQGYTAGSGAGMAGGFGQWAGSASWMPGSWASIPGSAATATELAIDAGALGGVNTGASGAVGAGSGALAGVGVIGALAALALYLDSKEGGDKVEASAYSELGATDPRASAWVDGSQFQATGSTPWAEFFDYDSAGTRYPSGFTMDTAHGGFLIDPANQGKNWDYLDGGKSPNDKLYESLMVPFQASVARAIEDLGGSSAGMTLGLSYSADPHGTAGDFVRTGVADASGNSIYAAEYEAARGSTVETLGLEMQRMMLAAIKGSDVASAYTDAIGSMDIATATADELNAKLTELKTIQTIVAAIGDKYTQTLAEQAGGVGNLAALVSNYGAVAYTDAEQQKMRADALRGAFTSLGETMPTTMAAYRALVDAQDTTTEAGAKAAVQLMGLAGAMQQVTQQSEALAAQKLDMDIQILELEGKTIEALAMRREAELAAMDASLRPLQERLYALQDEQSVVGQATQSANTFVETMNRFAMGVNAGFGALGLVGDSIGTLSGGDYGTTLSMQEQYLQASLADLEEQLAAAATLKESEYLRGQILGVEDALAAVSQEYATYLDYETMNPGHGQALMELQDWYDAQKAAADDNAAALALVEAAYWQRRQNILDSATTAELSNLEEWLRNLQQGPLSPLAPVAQYELAAQQYADMMASGDMSHYTELSDAYLRAAEAMFGHGGDYTAIYNDIVANARDQLDGEMMANDHREEQIAETRTTNAELRGLRQDVARLTMELTRATERGGAMTKDELINATRAIIDGANKQAAATERAAQLAKTQ